MFGGFKTRILPFDETSQVLLSTATAIIHAGSVDSDVDAALQGLAVVLPFVAETRRNYGIDMHPDSTFSNYLQLCSEPYDLIEMAEDTRGQAEALLQCTNDGALASYVYMWYTGATPGDSEIKSQLLRQTSVLSAAGRLRFKSASESFESWLEQFKIGAGSVNVLLSDHEGGNLIDLMDHTPLRRAFSDGREARQLGIEFGNQFDFANFFGGKSV